MQPVVVEVTPVEPGTPAAVRARVADSIFNHAAKAIEIEDIEARVAESHEVGSHILFITSIEHETLAPPDSGVQLFHSFSSYRRHLLHEEATRKENPIGPF